MSPYGMGPEYGRANEDDNVLALFGEFGETAMVSNESTVSSANVDRAVMLVEHARIVPQILAWRAEDRARLKRGSNGGRPGSITIQTILNLLFILAQDGKGLLISNMATLVSERMSVADLEKVGLSAADVRRAGLYQRLWRVAHTLVGVFDPYPSKRQGILSWEQHVALQQAEMNNPEFIKHKKARLDWFANALLEASTQTLPRKYRKWTGNTALDATLVRAFGKTGPSSRFQRVASDRDGGYYGRDGDHSVVGADGRQKQKKFAYGYEATLAVQAPNAPAGESEFPLLAIGMGFHRPGVAIGDEARNVMQSVLDRGHPAGFFLGDLAYTPNAMAEKLQIPLLKAGYKIVSQLKDSDLGIQDHFEGAPMIEGTWYCPSMPQKLIDSTKAYRAVLANPKATQGERHAAYKQYMNEIEERKRYRLREKEKADSEGRVPLMCPAIGPNATVSCPLKANPINDRAHPNHKTLMPISRSRLLTPDRRQKICNNKSSVSFPVEAGAKFKQALAFGSQEHRDTYALRTVVESYNAYAKDPNHNNIGEAGLRQLRGHGAQYMLTAILIAVSNLRKIRRFLEAKANEAVRAQMGPLPARTKPAKKRVGQYERRLNEARFTSMPPPLAAPPRI